MLESGVRGLHSTGVWADGAAKREPVGVYDATLNWLQPSKIVSGHVRYSTSGDYHDNTNNQPLMAKNLVLSHNGIISMASNFAEIFDEPCTTANDSEVLLRKIIKHALSANLDAAITQALYEIDEVQQPIFACSLVDSVKQSVYLFRDDIRPLHLYWVEDLACWVWTSTEDIMKRGCKYQYSEYELEPFKVYKLNPTAYKPKMVAKIRIPSQNPQDFSDNPTLITLQKPVPSQEVSRGVDYRINRRQGFIDYYASIIATWDVDPAYPLMKYLIDRYELSREQQYWLVFLYATFYHVASVHWVMQEFPDFQLVDVDRLQQWHDKHWRLLQYETDRRHEKGKFVEGFKSYQAWVGSGTQEEKFIELLDPEGNQMESYRRLNKSLDKLAGFGRYTKFYYTEALARCVGLPIMCDHIPLKDCESSRNGLAHALKREDLVDCLRLTKEDYQFLYWEQEKLMDEIREQHPELPVDYWLVETATCAYKGLFRRRRYIGYYIDRLHEEIVAIEEKDKNGVTSGVCWSVLEDFRQEYLDPRYLASGRINQKYLHVMIDDGELAMLHPEALKSELEGYDVARVEVNCPVRLDNDYKPASADRIKDTRLLPYLNWKIEGCAHSKDIYEAIKSRPLKAKK